MELPKAVYSAVITADTPQQLHKNLLAAVTEWEKKSTKAAVETEVEDANDDIFGETETEEKDEAPAYSLKEHIIPAFQKYAKKHSREDAAKILKKFKVKSVHDLKKDVYPDVMEALN